MKYLTLLGLLLCAPLAQLHAQVTPYGYTVVLHNWNTDSAIIHKPDPYARLPDRPDVIGGCSTDRAASPSSPEANTYNGKCFVPLETKHIVFSTEKLIGQPGLCTFVVDIVPNETETGYKMLISSGGTVEGSNYCVIGTPPAVDKYGNPTGPINIGMAPTPEAI